MIMTQGGKVIRCPMKNVRKIGRATQGVRVFNVGEGDVVSALALIPKEVPEEAEESEEAK